MKHKKTSPGFSIIEVLFSLVIIGVVLTAVAALITNSMKTRADTRYREIANHIAQDIIEACHRKRAEQTWGEFISSSGDTTCLGATGTEDQVGVTFTKTVTPTITTDKMDVAVSVEWKSGRGGSDTTSESIELTQTFTNWL